MTNATLAAIGVLLAVGGYAASYLPPIYAATDFWTSSPTFFFLRLGLVIAFLPLAYVISAVPTPFRAAMQEFGRSSLFVYWIHVEMAYGIFSAPIHRRLPFEWAMVGWLLLTLFLFALVRLKKRLERHEIRHLGDDGPVQHLARALIPAFVVDKEKIAQRTVDQVKPQV